MYNYFEQFVGDDTIMENKRVRIASYRLAQFLNLSTMHEGKVLADWHNGAYTVEFYHDGKVHTTMVVLGSELAVIGWY